MGHPRSSRPARRQGSALRLKAVLLASLLVGGFFIGGCTRTYEAEVIRVPCDGGHLVISERYELGKVGRAHFEMHLVTDGTKRLVDTQRHYVSLYASPTPAERYRVLRTAAPEEIRGFILESVLLWPVFIDPKQFTPEEYDRISTALSDNLDAIDDALAQLREPQRAAPMPTKRRPVIVSTRYVDPAALGRVYHGPSPLRVEVSPHGYVRFTRPADIGGTLTSLIGYVVDNGRRILLVPDVDETSPLGWSLREVLACKNPAGRTLGDEFVVERATAEAYGTAEIALRDRESEFHEITRMYARSYHHPTRPFSIRIERSRQVVLTGMLEEQPFLRAFGHVVDKDETLLLPPEDTRARMILASVPPPGIPDRAAFVAECRDANGDSPLDRFRLEVAPDIANYRDRVGRTWTRATGP
jgi:hypothetical protein